MNSKKTIVEILLNFGLAVLVMFVFGIPAGAVIMLLTLGWLYAWRRGLLTPLAVFRALNIQFFVCVLMIWYWRR